MVACQRWLTAVLLSFMLIGSAGLSGAAQSAAESDPESLLFSRLLERAAFAPLVFGPENLDVLHDPEAIAFAELPDVWLENAALHAECAFESSATAWDCGFAFRVTADGQHYRLWIDSAGTWSLSLSSAGLVDTGSFRPTETMTVDLFVIGARGYLGINTVFIATLDLSVNQEDGRIAIGTGFAAETATANASTRFSNLAVRNPGNPAAVPSSSGPTAPSAEAVYASLETSAQGEPSIFGPVDGQLEHDPTRATFDLSGLDIADLFAHVECLPPADNPDGLWDCGLVLRVGPGAEQVRFVAVSDGFWAITQGPSEILASGSKPRAVEAQSDPIALDIALVGEQGYAAIDNEFVDDFRLIATLDGGDIGPGTAFYDMTYHENGLTPYRDFEVWSLNPAAVSKAESLTAATPVARQSSAVDSPYINGRQFTAPSGSISFTWTDGWSVQRVQEIGTRQTLTLGNGPLVATLLLYRSADAAGTCTTFRIAEIDAISANGVRTTPIETASSTSNAAIVTYSTTTAEYGNAVAEVWCMALPTGEVVALTQTAPQDVFLALVPDLLDPSNALQIIPTDSGEQVDAAAAESAAGIDQEILTAQEAEAFASFRLDPLNESGVGGYGLLERVRREIDVRALATGVQGGDVLVIRVGSCDQLDRASGDPFVVGTFDESGFVTGLIDIRLTLVVGQLPYVAVVYPVDDPSGQNPIACGVIAAGFL